MFPLATAGRWYSSDMCSGGVTPNCGQQRRSTLAQSRVENGVVMDKSFLAGGCIAYTDSGRAE